MLPALDTDGWRKVFENREIVGARITRDSVAEIVGLAKPGKTLGEPPSQITSRGYLGLFHLKDGRFMTVRTNQDGQGYGRPFTTYEVNRERYVLERKLSLIERTMIGIGSISDDYPRLSGHSDTSSEGFPILRDNPRKL
jgi:hypothetical protein